MSDGEKVSWLSTLAALWGLLLFVYVLVSVFPGPNADDADVKLPWMVGAFTVAYLLILSWRSAYLWGKKR